MADCNYYFVLLRIAIALTYTLNLHAVCFDTGSLLAVLTSVLIVGFVFVVTHCIVGGFFEFYSVCE